MGVVVDTLKLARRLEAAGFPAKQAADTAEAIGEAIGESVVTREYLDLRLAELKVELLTWMFGALAAPGGHHHRAAEAAAVGGFVTRLASLIHVSGTSFA
jgi:hypothetical protein